MVSGLGGLGKVAVDQRNQLIAEIKRRTRAYEKVLVKAGKEKEPRLSKETREARVLVRLIKGKFGCHETAVANLIARLTALPVDKEYVADASTPPRAPQPETFVALVPESNPNSHNYHIGRVAVINEIPDLSTGNFARGVDYLGSTGNWFPGEIGSFRCATDAEITGMAERQLAALLKNLLFIPVDSKGK